MTGENSDALSDEDVAAAVVALLVVRASAAPEPRPLREPLNPWVASGWVGPPAAGPPSQR